MREWCERVQGMKIVHIITDLNVGGAQVMLHQLLRHTDQSIVASEVVSLTDAGAVAAGIESLGIPVATMDMRGGVPDPMAVLRLARWLRRAQPDVIQTWLYQGDLLGGLAARIAGIRSLVWGIHNSDVDPQNNKRSIRWTISACVRASHYLPSKIVCCAVSAQQFHAALGYPAEKMFVIPNGFDVDNFKPDRDARASVRREFAIPDTAPLIGLSGRFHPQKDHKNFVRAAARLHARRPDARFMLCGEGSDWSNQELAAWIDEVAMRDQFHLLGRRQDMARIYASLDLLALSASHNEAFPMVIGEAMACGVPCVVTDVGDSALMVGDTGRVVPPKDAPALAEGWLELIELESEARQALGVRARQRIEQHYSIAAIVRRYENLYADTLQLEARRGVGGAGK